jgi:hypothetical protein
MKYAVRDKVRIRSQEWVEANKKYDPIMGGYITCGEETLVDDMFVYAGAIATIAECGGGRYHINLDDQEWAWTDEMFEDHV